MQDNGRDEINFKYDLLAGTISAASLLLGGSGISSIISYINSSGDNSPERIIYEICASLLFVVGIGLSNKIQRKRRGGLDFLEG